jgi:hypothetical protein
MTSRLVRLYALAATALGFSLAWAGVSSRPFPSSHASSTPAAQQATANQVALLNARARALQRRAVRVDQIVSSRRAAARRAAQAAAARPVQIQTIMLPAVTATRSS